MQPVSSQSTYAEWLGEDTVNKYVRRTSTEVRARKGKCLQADSHLTGCLFLHVSVFAHSLLQASINMGSIFVIYLALGPVLET